MGSVNEINSSVKEYNIYRKFINGNIANQKQKKDVLAKYPLRLLAYSNEVGSAISPISSSLGTALWAPALLYLGADIYDKYGYEDKTYNPSSKRAIKETIYQGLASVIMPTMAIKLGQKIGVRITTKNNTVSLSDKKELIEFTTGYIDYGNFPNSKQEYNNLTADLIDAFKHTAQENKKRLQNKGIISRVVSMFHEPKTPDSAMIKYLKNPKDTNPIIKYLKQQGDLATVILTSEKNIQAEKYQKYFKKMAKSCESAELAKKNTVLKILKDKNINKSLIATLSGFIALFIFAQPIDDFVEDVIMDKINPYIDNAFAKKTD